MSECTAVLWGGPLDGTEYTVEAPPPPTITVEPHDYLLTRPGINGRFKYVASELGGGRIVRCPCGTLIILGQTCTCGRRAVVET